MAVAKRKLFIRKKKEEMKQVKKAVVKKVAEEKPVIIPAPEPEVVESEAAVEKKEAETTEPQEKAASTENTDKPTEETQKKDLSDSEEASVPSAIAGEDGNKATEAPEPTEEKAEEQSESSNSVLEPLPPIEIKEKKRGFFWQFALFVFIGFALGSGFFLSQELLMKGIPAMKKAVPTTVIEEVHFPTQPVEEKKSAKIYTISVLNGSGIGGEAAKAKTVLEGEKYTVENVGNADTSDYTQTLIQAKKAVEKEYLGALKKALEDNDYVVSEPEILSETEDTDIVIIVGSKRKE